MKTNINEPFLPTVEELESMSLLEFEGWIEQAEVELPLREIQRDPLTHFKKRISQVIQKDESEVNKEQEVSRLIRTFRNQLL
ncbi:hypothetical protein ACS127_10185 [Amphibacillus sp. Q70]|uniref:hypothetical protein n=1 Tax=Amphibacillus sp. Q70 TaxID=3453416 RepID=UPI003F86D10D